MVLQVRLRALIFLCLLSGQLVRVSATDPHFVTQGIDYIENKNQWEKFIRFEADIRGGRLFLENNRFTSVYLNQDDIALLHPMHATDKIRMHALRSSFLHANPSCSIEPMDKQISYRNYFLG